MFKNSDYIYYENYIKVADCASRAANLLQSVLSNYDTNLLLKKIEEIHAIENEADNYRHEFREMLSDAFMTPIERDDMLLISYNLDDIVDAIDEVLMRTYMCNIQTIREEAIEFTKLVIKATDILKKVMNELPNFKKSKNMRQFLIDINSVENEGDKLYLKAMHDLHREDILPIEVISWRDVFQYLERCLDRCEAVAKGIEVVMMKNS